MAEFWKRYPAIEAELSRVDAIVHDMLAGAGQSFSGPLRDQYQGGKRLRPGMMVLAAHVAAGDPVPNRLFRLAAAVELLHMASLIHDDIVDDAHVRRGRATLHRCYGTRDAVLMGDYLFGQAFGVMSELADTHRATPFARAAMRMCATEIGESEDRSLSIRNYFRRILGKTALLFSLSMSLGASEAGADRITEERLRRIGYNVGMAFQIVDDVLDYDGAQDNLGKNVGIDLRAGVITLPFIYAARNEAKLNRVAGRQSWSDSELVQVIRMVHRAGGVDRARDEAERFTSRARREIARLPVTPWREMLRDVSERLARRCA